MGVQFRWYSGDSNSVPPPPQPQTRRRRLAPWLALLAVTTLIVVGGLFWQSRRGLRAAQADLQRVVDREVEALRAGKQDAFLALLDSRYAPWLRYHQENFSQESAWYAARPGVRAQVESVELQPDVALVRIRLRNERGAQTEPVDWFYRRVDGQWRHGPPDSAYWGTSARIETDHIVLEAPAADEAAANRLAPELETLWCQVSQCYAAGEAEPNLSRFFLRIVPYGRSLSSNGVPSPQLALDLWSPAERLARLQREARYVVASNALAGIVRSRRSSAQSGSPSEWLVESLALWEAGGLTPEWRARIHEALADGTFRDVLGSPTAGEEAEALTRELYELPQQGNDTLPLMYALGEFLGNRYPASQLRDLLLALDSASSPWDAIQTVLGLDAGGLAAAWEAYLQEHYATS